MRFCKIFYCDTFILTVKPDETCFSFEFCVDKTFRSDQYPAKKKFKSFVFLQQAFVKIKVTRGENLGFSFLFSALLVKLNILIVNQSSVRPFVPTPWLVRLIRRIRARFFFFCFCFSFRVRLSFTTTMSSYHYIWPNRLNVLIFTRCRERNTKWRSTNSRRTRCTK